jgi:2-iminobutanoate/2-iminopropanoate deaminase
VDATLSAKTEKLPQKKEAIQRGSAPLGLPFSPGMKLGELLFVSGQGAFDGNGKIVDGDIKSQTRVTLENFKRIVEDAGSKMDNVLQTTVYLKDLADYAGMNEVYSGFFAEPRPARATLQVADLLFGMRVEIQGIAHVPKPVAPERC